MKTVLFIALLVLASCSRNPEKPFVATITPVPTDTKAFLDLSKDKEMFLKLRPYLDLSNITSVTGTENVTAYMAAFKDNPAKIYAINTLGNELLYASQMIDDKNGTIGLVKNGEAIIIKFINGVKEVKDISNQQFASRFAADFHGGTGFCQREKGESFGTCFKAESDEFCDSFISCVALATQPTVAILIGLACSCNAK